MEGTTTAITLNSSMNCSNADVQDVPPEWLATTSIFTGYSNSEFRRDFLRVPYYADMILTPIYILLGIFGNSVSFLVWSRRKLYANNSSAIYLAAVSCADVFFLQFYCVQYLDRIYMINVTGYRGVCPMYQVLFLTGQYLPISLTLTFTVERWMAICYPFLREVWCTPRRACWITLTVISLTAAVASVNFSFWKVNRESVCEYTESNLFQTGYAYFEQTLMSAFLPICTLTANILVIRELRKITHSSHAKLRRRAAAQGGPSSDALFPSQSTPAGGGPESMEFQMTSAPTSRNRQRSMSGDANGGVKMSAPRDESRAFRATTTMLLCVSFYLILCTLPSGAMVALQHVFPSGPECIKREFIHQQAKWHRFFVIQHVKEMVDLISSTHYVANFIIYLTTHQSYRWEFLRLLTCGKINHRDRDEYTIPLKSGPRGARRRGTRVVLLASSDGSNSNCTHLDNGRGPAVRNHRVAAATSDNVGHSPELSATGAGDDR